MRTHTVTPNTHRDTTPAGTLASSGHVLASGGWAVRWHPQTADVVLPRAGMQGHHLGGVVVVEDIITVGNGWALAGQHSN
jgi:hypothetical protein